MADLPAALPIPETSQPFLLQAGDNVLIGFRDHMTEADAGAMGEALQESFPDLRFWLLDGVGSVLVHRPAENGGAP